jgi:hypothetical protein
MEADVSDRLGSLEDIGRNRGRMGSHSKGWDKMIRCNFKFGCNEPSLTCGVRIPNTDKFCSVERCPTHGFDTYDCPAGEPKPVGCILKGEIKPADSN